MRTIPGAITTAEQGPALRPTHSATVQNELLSFAPPSANSNASLDVGVPQNYGLRASSTLGYATYRYTDGTHYVRVVDVTSAGDFQLNTSTVIGTSSTMYAMRSGLHTTGGTTYLYTAYPDSGQTRVRRATLSSTTNPPSVSFSNYNALFGQALTVISSFIRRVEAVCPTDDGVVVAIGEHDFINSLSTVTFYWLPSSSATIIQLNTIIQLPLTETFSAWYSNAKHCTFVSAISDGAGTICVVANALETGRAVTFTIKNGIESELRPVVPTDIEATGVSFVASALSRIGSLYYMTGRMTRRNSDGSAIGYDCYLTSADLRDWSLGERNHYLMAQQGYGTLLYPDNGVAVYYVGNLYHAVANATPAQNPSAPGQSLVLDNRIAGWTVSQRSNQADSFSCTLANTDGALTDSPVLKRGSVLYLDTGQDGTNADFGAYGIDSIDESVDERGRSLMTINGRDIAGKRLADWKCPVDVWLESLYAIRTRLTDLAGLILKTPENQSYTLSPSGNLHYAGLNEPWIAYADAPHADNTLSKVLVRFDVVNNWHVSSLGVLIGAADDGTGNVVLIPKTHAWPGYTQSTCKIRRLALPAIDPTDPDKEDTGFNLAARKNSLWVQSGNGALRTSPVVGGTERTASSFQVPVATAYDIAVRTAGRRVQVYVRPNNYTPSGTAANAGWSLIYEYLFDYQTRMRPAKKSYGGLTLCNDVFADTDAFAQAVHDDIEIQLTDADNFIPAFGALLTSGSKLSGQLDRIQNVASTAALNVDMYIRAFNAGNHDGIHRITGISGSTVFITPNLSSGLPDGNIISIYGQSPGDEAGYASSGQTKRSASGTDITINPKAEKVPRMVFGRAYFGNEPNTAGLTRYISSDGIRHVLRQISGTTKLGWDLTNPIPPTNAFVTQTYPHGLSTFSSFSDPAVWKMIFHHGYWFAGSPSAYGLPANSPAQQYFKVDDEVCRYAVATFTKRGGVSETWTVIPTYYAPTAAASAGTTQIRNWRASGGQQPGDDFGDIPNAAGLLVEISSRNGINRANSKQYYVQSVTKISNPTPGNTSYITLTGPYENAINGVDPYTLAGFGDVCIVSGRGQFGTKKQSHEPNAPVVYFPCDASGNQAVIRVSRYDYYSGLYLSVQDAIRRIAALAGQRDVRFRTAYTAAYATTPYTFTGGTSATTLPLYEPMANFILDLNALISSSVRLYVEFRDYYRLSLRHVGTGQLQCGLLTTSTDIAADGNGDRWLEYVTVPLTDYDFGWQNCDIRLAVQDNLVTVQVNRQHVWTFNLDHFTDGPNSYKRTTPGPIRVLYSASVGSNTATALVQELGDPVSGFAMRKTQTARAAIDELTRERHIKSRSTATGGIEFGQFRVRDNAGTLQKNLLRDNWKLEDTRNAGHVEVVGDSASGQTFDDATLRAEGYKFDVGDNKLAATASQCVLEARLWLREMKEAQELRSVSGYGRIALQPEDLVSLVYAPGGDVPAHPTSSHVLDSVSLSADDKSVKGTYTMRRYVSMF